MALIASLAGLVPLPMAPAYSASKAALIAWGEAQRRAWRGSGLSISIVCPGFVRTDMIEGLRFRAPFVWSAEKAADRIVRGLAKGDARIAFPWPLRAAIGVARCLPRPLAEAAFARPQARGRSS